MVVTVLLVAVVQRRLWKWPLALCAAITAPLLAIDLVFLGSNALKIADGGWFPIALGLGVILLIWTWTKGTRILADKARRDSIPLADLIATLHARAPQRVSGTAVFLTGDPAVTPVALLHNLKHNKVLHERNVILTVETADIPRIAEADRVAVERINDDFMQVVLHYGFMETPDIPGGLTAARRLGVKFDIMATSFFLGRRSVVANANEGMPAWQDRIYIFLNKNAANPTDFFRIPAGRVVLMGAQVSV